jgi:hypothetical protein
MTMETTAEARWAVAMAGLFVAFDVEATAERLAIYRAGLADVPLEAFERAVQTAIATRTYFPKVAELRALAGDAPPDVGLVEAMLLEHLRSTGAWRLAPSDPFLRLVCTRLGGYRAAAMMPGGQRLALLAKILPGAIASAQLLGLPMPNEQRLALSSTSQAMAQRAIAAAEAREAPYAPPAASEPTPATLKTAFKADDGDGGLP